MKYIFIIAVTLFSFSLSVVAQTNIVTDNSITNTTASVATNTTSKLIVEKEAPCLNSQKKKHSIGHKILFYIPNRALDLVDIFRLRAKVGPGISGGIRLTSMASFYGGKHNTVYVGLPGPRAVQEKPRPWGREKEKGITFFGVDATDDSKHEPEHSPSEIGLEVHLLLIGIDAGVDPVEFGDFIVGWIGKDPRGDDK